MNEYPLRAGILGGSKGEKAVNKYIQMQIKVIRATKKIRAERGESGGDTSLNMRSWKVYFFR